MTVSCKSFQSGEYSILSGQFLSTVKLIKVLLLTLPIPAFTYYQEALLLLELNQNIFKNNHMLEATASGQMDKF